MSGKIIHTALLLLFWLSLGAQEYRLELLPMGGGEIRGLVPSSFEAGDSMQAYRLLKQSLGEAQEMGYLAVSADSIVFDSTGARAYLWTGPRISWGRLSFDSIPPEVLRSVRISPSKFNGKYVHAEKLARVQSKMLEYYENNGFPFASIRIDSIAITGESLEGQLRIEPNGFFRVDSLHIRGDVKVHPAYLQKLTGITPGEPYNEASVRRISSRISETLFLEEVRPAELEFFEGGVDVYTYLMKNRSNQFNGIIGMLPAHGKTGKLQVTGDVNLMLLNSLGRGESFYFGWSSLEPLSQELEIELTYPYIFSSSIGVGLNFDLLKQDSTYLSLNPVLDFRFFLDGGSYLNAFIDHFSSSVISTTGLENSAVLPSYADVSGSLYGLGLRLRKLDYPMNPSRGWDIEARMGIGSRKIHKNSAIPDQAYEGRDLNTTKMQSTANISFYQPLVGRFVLRLSARTGLLRNEYLFENELFRLGGMNSLRGVDENSIYASLFGLGTVETRFHFEQGSAFFLFFDGGYYETDLEGEFASDTPVGFGAGLQISTGAGIFLLNYAIGKQFDNPINIGEAKIHIGYQNRF